MKSITQVVENLIKPYIDSHDRTAEAIIAPVETDATSASDDYVVGKQLILDNVLYDVIAPITTGDALVVNTNIKASDNVSSDIEALTNKLNNEIVTRSALGAKNLLNNTASTKTENGVTYTVNSDKSVTFSGTATDFSGLVLCSNQKFKAGKYILSGIFGSTGLDVVNIKWDYLSLYDASNTLVRTINLGNETDAELVIDLTNDVFDNITLALKRNNNTACSGTAYPMLRLYEDKGTEYQPYAKTNQELTAENQTLTNQVNDMVNVLGAKNQLKYSLTSGTTNEVVYTVNPDKTISVTTTEATATSRFINLLADLSNLIHGETYILNGCPSGGAIGTYVLYLADGTNDYIDTGNGVQFVYDSNKTYTLRFVVYAIVNLTTPIVFKPMIRLASIQDDTYERYPMTNREMTPYVQAISNPNLLDNPWFTVNQRGITTFTAQSTSGTKYTLDRWCVASYTALSVTVNADGTITIANSSGNDNQQFFQLLENALLVSGKTYTLSVDVVSYSGTVKFLCAGNTSPYPSIISSKTIDKTGIISNSGTYDGTANTYKCAISLDDGASVTIKALKLEIGSVSTLAMDTAPNYAEELLKCQRYFRKYIIKQSPAFVNSGNAAIRLPYVLTEGMNGTTRTSTTNEHGGITIANNTGAYITLTSEDISSIGCDSDASSNSGSIFIALSTTGKAKTESIKGTPVFVWNYTNPPIVYVSADL